MDDARTSIKKNSPRLIDQISNLIRERHFAYATEKTSIYWIIRYIRFHNMRHPKEMGKKEVEAFLSHLSNQKNHSKNNNSGTFNKK